MMNKNTFSKRQGLFSIKEKEITVREGAPEGLRGFIKMAFYDLGKNPSDLRAITSRVLKIPPDSYNWSEFPNIDYEVGEQLMNCKWYLVYDIIETIIQKLNPQDKSTFEYEINEYFITNGIGWKLVNGLIEIRGDEVFETAIKTVESTLEQGRHLREGQAPLYLEAELVVEDTAAIATYFGKKFQNKEEF